jgi:hypothetical protein
MAFPVSPTEGQTFTENNTVWIYSAVTDQWNRSVINPLNQTTYIGSDGAPGGIGGATQVIFNDNGSLASDAGLVYNKTTDVLTTGSLRATSLGTAAAPGIAFETYPSTGIYSSGANQLAVATNGTGRLFIDATGNVGVGLSNPSYPLEVASSTNSTINITGGTSNLCRLFFSDTALARGFLNYDHADDSINIGTAGSERLRITSAGLVGIGTSAPGYQLEVNSGTTDAAALFNSTAAQGSHVRFGRSGTVDGYFGCATGFLTSGTSAGDIGIRSQGALVLGSGGNNNRLFITSAGLVGIGTSAPDSLLQLNGPAARFRIYDSNGTNQFLSLQQIGAVSYLTGRNNTGFGPISIGQNNGTTTQTAIYIDSTARVGIGTASPDSLMHLESSSSFLSISNSTDTGEAGILFRRTDNNQNRGLVVYDYTADALKFRASDNGAGEDMRIDSSGRLGIGTSAPVGNLDVTFSNSTVYSNSNMFAGGISQYIYNSSTTDGVASTLALAAKGPGTTAQAAISAIYSSTGVGHLAFGTRSGGNVIERMRLTSTGLGIGTTSPSANGLVTIAETTNARLYLTDSTLGNTYGAQLRGYGLSGQGAYAELGVVDTNTYNRAITVTAQANNIVFGKGATEKARIDSSGRLLVGTSTSIGGSTLQVAGTGGNALEVSRFQAGNAGPFINIYKSRGAAVGTNTVVVSDDLLGALQFNGADGTGYGTAASIRAFVDSGTISGTSMPGRLVFSTTADGASSPTERMRIKSAGTINFSNVSTYADNTAALAGGLVAGDVYRKSDGTLMITY